MKPPADKARAGEGSGDEILDERSVAPLAPARKDVRVSMFADAFGQEPKDCELASVLEAIRGGRWKKEICRARELFAAWKKVCPALDSKESPEAKAYEKFKKTLPTFTISGTAKSRKEPLAHSNLLQVDCDKLNGTLGELREKVKADAHVAFGFVSPSGDGLKLGLAIDGERHAESFAAASEYFRQTYGVEIDPAVKDRLRLCFVSHDPDLWTREDAEPLPLPDVAAPDAEEWPEPDGEGESSAALSLLVMPSGSVSISESAREIFQRIAPSHSLFWRGGALVELVEVDGTPSLEILKPESFRSRVEKFGRLCAWRTGRNGKPCLSPCSMPRDAAAALMATTEARELPPVASVLRCPVIIENESGQVEILGKGYHPEQGGLLIVDGEPPPHVPVDEAAKALRWLVEEFDFQSEGDRSRALAAFVTPALRIGGHIKGNVPIDAAEADKSQSGKGYRLEMVVSLYRECAYIVTARQGGVGSVDESFAAALVAGRPFINLDNLRGKVDSQHLEAFLTAPGLFPARVPHCGEIRVNPRRFLVQLSSNGLQATEDLTNRASICRIRNRPGFPYRDTIGELQSRQAYFLGAVFSIVAEWVASGKPKTRDCRHAFREWNQTLDWICQNLLGTAPLMEGHQAAQERASNPALSWLRAVALAVAGSNRLGLPLIASELVELCDLHAIDIPGDPKTGEEANKQAGRLLRRVFKEGDSVMVDGFEIVRDIHFQSREAGGAIESKSYTFRKP